MPEDDPKPIPNDGTGKASPALSVEIALSVKILPEPARRDPPEPPPNDVPPKNPIALEVLKD